MQILVIPSSAVIFAAASLNSIGGYKSASDIKGMLDVAEEQGIQHLDTAYANYESEAWLGANQAASRFALSPQYPDFAAQVAEVLRICHARGFVAPTVCTRATTTLAVARLPEDELLPPLRKHDIAFYAYHPIAGRRLPCQKTVRL